MYLTKEFHKFFITGESKILLAVLAEIVSKIEQLFACRPVNTSTKKRLSWLDVDIMSSTTIIFTIWSYEESKIYLVDRITFFEPSCVTIDPKQTFFGSYIFRQTIIYRA